MLIIVLSVHLFSFTDTDVARRNRKRNEQALLEIPAYGRRSLHVMPYGPAESIKSCTGVATPEFVSCVNEPEQVGHNVFNKCSSYASRYSPYRHMLELKDWSKLTSGCPHAKGIIAVHVNENHEFSEDIILNLAALHIELAGLYDLVVLYQLKNQDTMAALRSPAPTVLYKGIPEALHPFVEFWSERQMDILYRGIEAPKDFSGHAATSYRRGCFMPLQALTLKYGNQYEEFVKWDIDARSTGHYADLFQTAKKYAREHEPNEDRDKEFPINKPIESGSDKRDADYISFSPIYNVDESWYYHWDFGGWYTPALRPAPPARKFSQPAIAIMSRSLLLAMHALNIGSLGPRKRSIFCDAWPASVAQYIRQYAENDAHDKLVPEKGFKSIYFPHEIMFQDRIPTALLASRINGPDFQSHQDRMWSSSWWWDAKWASELYEAWKNNDAAFIADETGHALMQHLLLHPVKAV